MLNYITDEEMHNILSHYNGVMTIQARKNLEKLVSHAFRLGWEKHSRTACEEQAEIDSEQE
ncbi:MAG: hypothetical protein II921_03360 [Treponema sp.]|nr:hypothetical protein [Treponema sp.]